MAIIWFYSINVKGNWAHLAEKNSRAGAKITTTQGIRKIFVLSQKILKTFVLLSAVKLYYVIKVSFKQ